MNRTSRLQSDSQRWVGLEGVGSSFIHQMFIEASCVPGPILDMEIAFEELLRWPGNQMHIIITHGAWFWGGTEDRACGRNVQSNLGISLRADF